MRAIGFERLRGSARPGITALLFAHRWRSAVFALDILLPPLVLPIARKPVTSFTINPLLSTLPEVPDLGGAAVFEERLDQVWGLALYLVLRRAGSSASSGAFAVTPSDLARFLSCRSSSHDLLRALARAPARVATVGERARGSFGRRGWERRRIFASPPEMHRDGLWRPVLPSHRPRLRRPRSTTIKWMSDLSTIGTTAVLVGASVRGVLWLSCAWGNEGSAHRHLAHEQPHGGGPARRARAG